MDENKRFEHNGFIYTCEGIEYPKDRVKPNELYKYFSLNKNSFDCVVNEYLFFSHPDMLNDLIDSSKFLLNLSNCDKTKYEGIMKYFLSFERFDEKDIPTYEEAKSNNFWEMSILINDVKFFNMGTLSLSKNKYSTLMMAHYANESGFVLELDLIKLEKNLKSIHGNNSVFIFPMNYCDKVDRIDYFENIKIKKEKTYYLDSPKLITKHSIIDLLPMLYMTSVKNDVWKYEDEWRVLIRKPYMGIIKDPLQFREYHIDYLLVEPRKINYNEECLKKIILGPLFFNNKYFKEKKSDLKNRINYSVNTDYFKEEKEVELFKSFIHFLKIISSEKFKNKVYLQNIQIDKKGFQRYSLKLDVLSFNNDVFSFNYTVKRY